MAKSPLCDCGAPEQTIIHIVQECFLRKFQGTWNDINVATAEAVRWIVSLDIEL